MSPASPLYADDFEAGTELPFSSYTLTEAAIVEYASQWDPLPMHTDPVAAAEGAHGGLIASGLQTLAVYQRLIVEVLWSRVVGVGGRGFDVRFRRPVRPGTTLTGRARIERVEARPQRGTGVLHLQSELHDERGEVVLEVICDAVLKLRPVG